MPKIAATREIFINGFGFIEMKESENSKTCLSKLDVVADKLAQFVSPKSDEDFNPHLIRNLTNFYETERRPTLANPKTIRQETGQFMLNCYHEYECKQAQPRKRTQRRW